LRSQSFRLGHSAEATRGFEGFGHQRLSTDEELFQASLFWTKSRLEQIKALNAKSKEQLPASITSSA